MIRKIIKKWKRENNGHVILGGPIASDPKTALRRTRADIAVIGEGEKTVEKLCEVGLLEGNFSHDELYNIRGLSYQNNNEICVTQLRPFMAREEYDQYTPSIKAIKFVLLSIVFFIVVKSI